MEIYLSIATVITNIIVALVIFKYAQHELVKQAESKGQNIIVQAKEELLPYIIEEGIPSLIEFAESEEGTDFMNSIIDPIVSGLQKRIYGAIGGLASGETRGMKALEKAAAEDLISGAHPVVSVVLDKLPSVKKLLTDNPQLLALLPQIAQKYQGFIGQVLPQHDGSNPTQIRGL